MRNVLKLAAAAVALFALSLTSAQAQATRTWVSGTGDDANPCSRTAPCKTFPGAISKTAAGGEINVIDPGGFGGVTITKSISIISEIEAGVLVSGTNAIIINSATANVNLRGLDIEGLGTGLAGVNILAANLVNIENSRIRGFRGNASSAGIQVGNGGAVSVQVSDTTLWNNLRGINVAPAAGASASISMDRVKFYGNNQALRVSTGGTGFLSNSVITQNPAGVAIVGTGVVNSFGNNLISGNATDIFANPLTPANLR
jgi:hypothetical protein